MSLRDMSDKNLLVRTKRLVKDEFKITAEIIDHLGEIEYRKLYSDIGYESLYVYGIEELGYSEDQIYRRINALKLAKKIPLAKEKIVGGDLTLTNVNLLSGFFNVVDDLQEEEKEKIVERVSNTSKEECQNILFEIKEEKGYRPQPRKPTIKNESSYTVRLSISLKKETMKKLEILKGMYAHKDLTLEEVIDLMATTQISKEREELTPKRDGKDEGKGRYIPKGVKKEAMERAGYKCEQCESTYALQYEHVIPFSVGGKSNSTNIKILCKNCNLRSGIKFFGEEKMRSRQRGPEIETQRLDFIKEIYS